MSSDNALKTFEFTKRKRWADLLVSELADGINVILSETCAILYCAPIITEITGWKSAELVDCDFLELIASAEDQSTFRASFEASISNNSPLLSYIRINCNASSSTYPFPPKNVLFEVQGQPSSTNPEGIVLFAVMKPFPSRNTDSLSMFVDIKMDNDRLQRRHMELHKRLPQKTAVSPLTVVPAQIYATSPITLPSNPQSIDGSSSSYQLPTGSLTDFGPLLGTSVDSNIFTGGAVPPTNLTSLGDDENDDTSRRKKLKKTAGEQYVCITCGRTDSPEWRKGPLGPKTLCNACGLRWAKQARSGKVPEESMDTVQFEQ